MVAAIKIAAADVSLLKGSERLLTLRVMKYALLLIIIIGALLTACGGESSDASNATPSTPPTSDALVSNADTDGSADESDALGGPEDLESEDEDGIEDDNTLEPDATTPQAATDVAAETDTSTSSEGDVMVGPEGDASVSSEVDAAAPEATEDVASEEGDAEPVDEENAGAPDVEECTPDCSASTCGDDGCGGSCGTCDEDATCDEGACVIASLCPSEPTGTNTGEILADWTLTDCDGVEHNFHALCDLTAVHIFTLAGW